MSELFDATDVLSTLVDLCALRIDRNIEFDGLSMAGVASGTETTLPERTAVIQYGYTSEQVSFGRSRAWASPHRRRLCAEWTALGRKAKRFQSIQPGFVPEHRIRPFSRT